MLLTGFIRPKKKKKKILPKTVKKCFVKAGFPAQASPDTQDIAVQNLKEIVDLCMQGKM
jgi:hypothetical protein